MFDLLQYSFFSNALIGVLIISVAAAFIEPIIRRLVEGELMVRMGDGRVYTDFIIYGADDSIRYLQER